MSGNEWDANTDQNEEGQEAPLSHVDYGRAEASEPVAAEAPHSNEVSDGSDEPEAQPVAKKSRKLKLRPGGLKKLANVKRETRIGMATMLSFLILVTAFIVNRNRSHPKTDTPSAKASGTPVAIKYQPEPEPTVVKAREKDSGAESPPAQTPVEPGKDEGSRVNDPNPSAIVLASADGLPPGDKVEPPAPKTPPAAEPPKADKPLDPPAPQATEPKAVEPAKSVVPEPPKPVEVPATPPAQTTTPTALPGGELAPGLSPPSLAPPTELPPTANELLAPPAQPATPIPSTGLLTAAPKTPETPKSNPPTELPPSGPDAPPAVPGLVPPPEAAKQPEPKKEEPKKEAPASAPVPIPIPIPVPVPVPAPSASPPPIDPPPASNAATHAAPATLPDLPMTPAPLDQKGLNVTQPVPVNLPKPAEPSKPPAGEEQKKPEPGELPTMSGTPSLPASEVLPSAEPAINKAPETASSPFPEPAAPRQITSTPFDSTKMPTITSEPKSAIAPPGDLGSKPVVAKAIPLGPGWAPLRKVGRSSFAMEVDTEPLTAKQTIPDGPPPKHDRSAKEDVEPVLHVVQRTENFWTISRLYYGSGRYYRALWSYNRSKVPDIKELFVGTTIKVPPPELLDRTLIDTPSLATSAPAVRPKPTDTGRTAPSDSQVRTVPGTRGKADLAPDLSLRQPVSRAGAEDVDPPSHPTYRVRANDTLRAIAKQTLGDAKRDREILELNRALIDDPRRLTPGQTLILPADAIVATKVR